MVKMKKTHTYCLIIMYYSVFFILTWRHVYEFVVADQSKYT